MKKTFLAVILSLVCFIAIAQNTGQTGDFLSRLYNRVNYDTAYIGRPVGTKWTIKLRTILLWQNFHTKGIYEDTEFASSLRTDLKPKLNMQVGYMGIAIGGGVSFNKLIGREDRDFDFKLNMYGKKFGFEFGLSGISSLHGTYTIKFDNYNFTFNLPEDFVEQVTMTLNFYYAFNNKKFSYPAAFTQMFIQKKSAGSLLAGGELYVNAISIGDSIQETELYKLTNATLGIGVGYGYNLVLPHDWLLHLSCLPYLVVDGGATLRNYGEGEETRIRTEFPEVFLTARGAIIHNFNARWFAGITMQLNYSNVNSKKMTNNNMQWQAIGFAGMRL